MNSEITSYRNIKDRNRDVKIDLYRRVTMTVHPRGYVGDSDIVISDLHPGLNFDSYVARWYGPTAQFTIHDNRMNTPAAVSDEHCRAMSAHDNT